jgi:aspartyl/asparaginyl beta-hydroxylase (cupin superfamily)
MFFQRRPKMDDAERLRESLRITPENAKPSSALIPKRPLIMRFGRWAQPKVNEAVAGSSRVGNPKVFDPALFPWIAKIEANWEVIREEAAVVLGDLDAVPPLAAISPDHRRIAPAGKWRSFFLIGYRYRDEVNCRACPRTAALISEIPGLNSAFFSILLPGTHIPPHTGVTKAIITAHLGIQVPRDPAQCWMRVDDEIVHWQEGRVLVFDDMYNHEVKNESDETRIVLLIQIRRPVGIVGKIVGGLFLEGVRRSRFVQDARRGVQAWKEYDLRG